MEQSRTHRSVEAAISEHVLRRVFPHPTPEMVERAMKVRKELEVPVYRIPPRSRILIHQSLAEESVDGMQVFRVNRGGRADFVILYLHGGAYVREFYMMHWHLINRLAEDLDACVIAPDYPLLPRATYRDAYEKVTALYRQLQEEEPDRRIILAGDSAGGGLSLGLAEYWREEGIPLPEKMILISPWVDISMENEQIPSYESADPMHRAAPLRVYASYWAGGEELQNERISPIYGSLQGLPRTLLFAGTREILYPDVEKLCRRMKEAGVEVEMITGEGMNHDYPLYPIPEAADAVRRMEQFITD